MSRFFSKALLVFLVGGGLLGLPATAVADEIKFLADLNPTPVEPLADGLADWTMNTTTGQVRLTIDVDGIATTNLVMAFVNKRFVGYILIAGGSGSLVLDSSLGDGIPRVKNGTLAEMRRAGD